MTTVEAVIAALGVLAVLMLAAAVYVVWLAAAKVRDVCSAVLGGEAPAENVRAVVDMFRQPVREIRLDDVRPQRETNRQRRDDALTDEDVAARAQDFGGTYL